MQGSTHFCRIQLLVASHSELTVHSGRQLGGDPKKSGKHEQVAYPLLFLHTALLPHGLGVHGSLGSAAVIKYKKMKMPVLSIFTKLKEERT